MNRVRVGPRQRVLGYARTALDAARTMGRYGVAGDRAGLSNGLRTLSALGAELGRAARGAGGERICPLCGWRGARFGPAYYYDAYREDARCWACHSTERCRLFKLYLDRRLAGFFGSGRRRVLDVGPVSYSRAFFPREVAYASFDLRPGAAGVRGDLARAPFADGALDFWLCSHVLDVVPDDGAALRELLRVLRPGGLGLLDNAMSWDSPTREFGAPQRGACGRLRRYGRDLPERLGALGFAVEIVDPLRVFDAPVRRRHGLREAPFLLCRRPLAGTARG